MEGIFIYLIKSKGNAFSSVRNKRNSYAHELQKLKLSKNHFQDLRFYILKQNDFRALDDMLLANKLRFKKTFQ